MVKEKNAPLILASLSSILSFICLMIAIQLPPNTSSNVLGTTSSNLVPCSVINNWQKLYCSNIGPTGTPSNIPTPRPTTYCKTGISSSVYGPTCIVSNIAKGNFYLKFTCYGGYSSVVGSEASCYTQSELMILANRVCSSHSPCSPTTTARPTISPPRTTPFPPTSTPTGVGTSGLQITRSCNPNGTFNFTVSGYLNPPPSYVNGIHYLVMNNTTGKYYHQGYQAGSNLPVRVAVSAAGYLTDTNGYLSEPTDPKNSYTIHFVDAAYNTPVSWTSPYISSYFIPPSPGGCPIVVTVTPTRAPTITPTRAPSPVPTVRISTPTPHL